MTVLCRTTANYYRITGSSGSGASVDLFVWLSFAAAFGAEELIRHGFSVRPRLLWPSRSLLSPPSGTAPGV